MDAKPTNNTRRPRRGFTLVEMLAVVLIIGILAGLITAAAFKAMDRAKLTVIKLDCNQLDMAMNAYKDKYGDYPPDFCGVARDRRQRLTYRSACNAARAAVVRAPPQGVSSLHTGPDFQAHTGTEWDRVCARCGSLRRQRSMFATLTPASAIVFWLGGMPALDGSKTLTGFSANPENPFARRRQPHRETLRVRRDAAGGLQRDTRHRRRGARGPPMCPRAFPSAIRAIPCPRKTSPTSTSRPEPTPPAGKAEYADDIGGIGRRIDGAVLVHTRRGQCLRALHFRLHRRGGSGRR